jgi:Co/Zn/Cd efflux system component
MFASSVFVSFVSRTATDGGGHGHSHGGGGHGHSHGAGKTNHSHGHHHLAPEGDIPSREASPQLMTPTPDSEVDSVSEKSGKQLNQAPSAASQMNMRGVFLHVLADALGSVIVCASACVIMFTNFEYKDYVDPTLSVLMVTLIMYSTWGLLVESAMILLQTVPTHIQIDSLQRKLLQEVIELLLNVCLLFDCSGFSGSFMSLATFIVFKVSIEMSRINVIFQELQTRDFNFFLC